MDGVFVGSGIFKSGNPEQRARAIVQAVTHYRDAKLLAQVSMQTTGIKILNSKWLFNFAIGATLKYQFVVLFFCTGEQWSGTSNGWHLGHPR